MRIAIADMAPACPVYRDSPPLRNIRGFELGNFTWNDLKKLEDAAREAKMAQECSEFADSVIDLSGDGGPGIE